MVIRFIRCSERGKGLKSHQMPEAWMKTKHNAKPRKPWHFIPKGRARDGGEAAARE
jgi:hypothetical protein